MLIRIDDRNYRAEVKRAEAAVTTAKMNVTRETGLADYAALEFERSKSLLSSKSATDLALRKPQLAEAISTLEYAEADLERKSGDLSRTTIRAPYDGLVREKRVDIGQYVGAGTALAMTFAVDYAEVRLPLPDRELPFLDLPDSFAAEHSTPMIKVILSARQGGEAYQWEGRIVRTEGVFDQNSRVLYVVAQVADPYNRIDQRWQSPLRIGTFVEAKIQGRQLDDVIVLPRGVLRADDLVWTVGDDDTLMANHVTLIRADETSIYVATGLEPGQLVCKTLVDNPLPGSKVRYEPPADTVSSR